MVNTKDSAKISATVRKRIRQEMAEIEYQVQNWQSIAQQSLQAKQGELLEPVYRKVYVALQQVAKDGGYTHVFNREALLLAPNGDDLMPLVAKKLNLKLPPNYTPGFKTN
jgi:outer membrane protein